MWIIYTRFRKLVSRAVGTDDMFSSDHLKWNTFLDMFCLLPAFKYWNMPFECGLQFPDTKAHEEPWLYCLCDVKSMLLSLWKLCLYTQKHDVTVNNVMVHYKCGTLSMRELIWKGFDLTPAWGDSPSTRTDVMLAVYTLPFLHEAWLKIKIRMPKCL
jgi:hypothetical protein